MEIDIDIDDTLLELENLYKKLKEDEKDYEIFYKGENIGITVCYIYINKENEIYDIKQDIIKLQNNMLDSDELFNIINNYKINKGIRYKLNKILKYNISLDPRDLLHYLKNPNDYNYLYECRGITDIVWDDTIMLLQEVNSLYVLYNEYDNNKYNNKTKKVYIRKNINKKSKKKYTRKRI